MPDDRRVDSLGDGLVVAVDGSAIQQVAVVADQPAAHVARRVRPELVCHDDALVLASLSIDCAKRTREAITLTR